MNTEWLVKYADWLEGHYRRRRAHYRQEGSGSGPCDPKQEPHVPGASEACLIQARIQYLSDLIDCLELPANEQAGCCADAYTAYLAACNACIGPGGG